MTGSDPKAHLRLYLREGRDSLMWKLDGLSEYDLRRPLTPTGTNLLGIVKHVASLELLYFGGTFGRPSDIPLPWLDDDAEPNADLWATPDESREDIVGLYRRAWAHADATIDSLPLDAPGEVAWWSPGNKKVTLHKILVHMIAETHRHAGQADIVREMIDGTVGCLAKDENMAPGDEAWWEDYRNRLEQAAGAAGQGAGGPRPPGKVGHARPGRQGPLYWREKPNVYILQYGDEWPGQAYRRPRDHAADALSSRTRNTPARLPLP